VKYASVQRDLSASAIAAAMAMHHWTFRVLGRVLKVDIALWWETG